MKFRFCGDLDCPDWVLAEINTLSKMSSIRVKILVSQIILYCLEGELNYEKVLKLAADNADGIQDIKGAIAAVHFMVTNAAKYDIEDNVLIQEIQQLGLPKENSDMIAKQYRENKESLRTKFSEDSYRIAGLLSIDWRVDAILASSSQNGAQQSEAEKIVHLNMHIDSKPGADSAEKKYTNIAFELSSTKLDTLIKELTQVHQTMHNLDS